MSNKCQVFLSEVRFRVILFITHGLYQDSDLAEMLRHWKVLDTETTACQLLFAQEYANNLNLHKAQNNSFI